MAPLRGLLSRQRRVAKARCLQPAQGVSSPKHSCGFQASVQKWLTSRLCLTWSTSFATSQFSRTIQNYQKAFRKKVEGMKVELKSARNTNEALRRQVKRLKSPGRTLLPGMAIGVVLGVVGSAWFRRLKRNRQPTIEPPNSQEEVLPAAQ